MKHMYRLLFALSLFAYTQAQAGCGSCGPKAEAEDHDHSRLHESMEAIGDAYKALSTDLRRAKTIEHADKYLKLVDTLQKNILISKLEIPELVKEIKDPVEQANMSNGYRTGMAKLLVASCQLEMALLNGDASAVSAALKEMKGIKSKGHDAFTEEDEE